MTPLVSVIVPAHNAGATIGAALRSVRRQTWTALEIVVVNDGSTDGTAAEVERQASEDPRIRLIAQSNQGVASARNRGMLSARGTLAATLDADDLWRPTKLAKQVAMLEAAGDAVGLVYTWFARIDAAGCVIDQTNRTDAEGDVLRRMCMGNLVGNGSSPLMRRDLVLELGGYDPGLRAQGAEGCEDLKLYFQIAERSRFAVVREHLTGYRLSPNNMSSRALQMLRSYDLVMKPFRAKYGAFAEDFHAGRTLLIEWLLERAVADRRRRLTVSLLCELFGHAPARALEAMLRAPVPLWCDSRVVTERRAFLTASP